MISVVNNHNCLHLLKTNENAAWQYLIRIYFPVLFRFAHKILKDEGNAEDVVSDVFVKLWQQHADFDDWHQLKKYLYTATRNNCLNALRSKQREKARHESFTNAYIQNEDDLGNEILYSELLAETRKAVYELPPKMREVFILAYFKKMTNEEIALYLKLSNQTVRNQKATALAMLRKSLQPKFSLTVLTLAVTLEGLC